MFAVTGGLGSLPTSVKHTSTGIEAESGSTTGAVKAYQLPDWTRPQASAPSWVSCQSPKPGTGTFVPAKTTVALLTSHSEPLSGRVSAQPQK